MSDILANLLDGTLDDIADLPSFAPFPSGIHNVKASLTVDEIQGKAVIKLDLVMVESVELANPEAEAPQAGDSCNTVFFLDNEYGLGNFKRCAAPFQEAFQCASTGELIEQVTDIDCVVVTNTRPDKKDPTRTYLDVQEISVV